MELILGYEILESYKRLSYKAWYAFAEFIDNSTQSYRNKKVELDEWFTEEETSLSVTIKYNNNKQNGFISIEDNAYGMSEEELQNALILGKKPLNHSERSKYGLGLKTAAFWFGDKWTLTTSRKGSKTLLTVVVDLKKILKDEHKTYSEFKINNPGKPFEQFTPQLAITYSECNINYHGTTLKIEELNRVINSTTASNCIEYLQSIYRKDLQNETLYLEFQNKPLTWSQDEIDGRLLSDSQGNKYKRYFSFEINGKPVSGWAGILASGARKFAGFSLIQADRVIVGYPSNYKNSLIFGAEEGGTNNLVNQRLIGEIELDGFAVSHTKDQILFADDEEEELNEALFKELADYKDLANSHRVKIKKDVETEADFDFETAVARVLNNLNTQEYREVILNESVLPEDVLAKTNEEVIERLERIQKDSYHYVIDDINVQVILSENSSPYDPYLIVKTLSQVKHITIVININHPYWIELDDNSSRFNFLVSCIYDGVSEWKAKFRLSTINPDTIKYIKDHLLRLELKNI